MKILHENIKQFSDVSVRVSCVALIQMNAMKKINKTQMGE